jgi:hypothetical protein
VRGPRSTPLGHDVAFGDDVVARHTNIRRDRALDLERKAVCTKCGMIGADVRPNWSKRPSSGSLTGAQWRGPKLTL